MPGWRRRFTIAISLSALVLLAGCAQTPQEKDRQSGTALMPFAMLDGDFPGAVALHGQAGN